VTKRTLARALAGAARGLRHTLASLGRPCARDEGRWRLALEPFDERHEVKRYSVLRTQHANRTDRQGHPPYSIVFVRNRVHCEGLKRLSPQIPFAATNSPHPANRTHLKDLIGQGQARRVSPWPLDLGVHQRWPRFVRFKVSQTPLGPPSRLADGPCGVHETPSDEAC
jgi:hypothetical protein